jgi:hypothetical protein
MATREIKFRGVLIGTTTWKYGSYVRMVSEEGEPESHHIIDWKGVWNKVVPETVGQLTGLKDCESKEIYEDDIIRDDGNRVKAKVEFIEGEFRRRLSNRSSYPFRSHHCYTIIGNIHQTPDLLL